MKVTDRSRLSAIDRPRFRGVLHFWCFVVSVPIGVALVISAPTSRAVFAAAVFAFGTSMMFGISALFHRTTFDDHGWFRFRRLDHMGIYLAIAGGYTAFGLLALDGWQGKLLLIVGWTGAALGICLRFLLFKPPVGMMNTLFISLGWLAALTLPELWGSLGLGWLALTAAGGVVYTLGALVVGARWPNPWPRTFGYHEIWHVMVAVAAAMHYA
ncbi:MAG: hemolysin III family protein, partial [Acidimicrobiales bacterium]